MRFKDKVVLLSGAASGFGREAALRFAAQGARLSLSDINVDGLAETAGMIDADVMTTIVDVREEDQQNQWVAQTVEKMGRIDYAINNAGVIHELKSLLKTPVDEFDRMMAINARGVFIGMRAQVPVMIEQGGGVILNTASVAGLIGAPAFGAYVASKHAVVGLTKTAALEYGKFGIRINAICPAYADTPMLEAIAEELKQPGENDQQDTYDRLSKGLPLGRVGEAEEIVDAMMLICDPSNTFMTGQGVAGDGGLTAN